MLPPRQREPVAFEARTPRHEKDRIYWDFSRFWGSPFPGVRRIMEI
jgi:hypothetical protein